MIVLKKILYTGVSICGVYKASRPNTLEMHMLNEHQLLPRYNSKEINTESTPEFTADANLCNMSYASIGHLKRQYICEECDYKANKNFNFQRHMKKVHNKETANNTIEEKEVLIKAEYRKVSPF